MGIKTVVLAIRNGLHRLLSYARALKEWHYLRRTKRCGLIGVGVSLVEKVCPLGSGL
jgi:hypothetical protein